MAALPFCLFQSLCIYNYNELLFNKKSLFPFSLLMSKIFVVIINFVNFVAQTETQKPGQGRCGRVGT